MSPLEINDIVARLKIESPTLHQKEKDKGPQIKELTPAQLQDELNCVDLQYLRDLPGFEIKLAREDVVSIVIFCNEQPIYHAEAASGIPFKSSIIIKHKFDLPATIYVSCLLSNDDSTLYQLVINGN